MAESGLSVYTDVIYQKLDYVTKLPLKNKHQLLGLQDSIANIRKLLIDAQKQLLVESHRVETWQKQIEDALKANNLMNNDEPTGLKNTILQIQNVLSDAEKKHGDNKRVTTWLKKLEDVVYEAGDLVDEVFYEATKHRAEEVPKHKEEEVAEQVHKKVEQVSNKFKVSNKLKDVEPVLNKLGKLKNINEKLAAAGHDAEEIIKTSKESHEDLPHKVFTKGFDPNFEILPSDCWMWHHVLEVRKFLLEERNKEQQLVAVAIVGYGGLGKTTLAQQVFLDWKINRKFKLTIWLNVLYDFNIRSLVEGIIMYANKMKHNRQLIDTLREREIDRIFMSLVEGVIKSTTKTEEDDAAKKEEDDKAEMDESEMEIESKSDSQIEELIDDFLYYYDQWEGFETEIKSAIDKHFHHLDKVKFGKAMSDRQKDCMRQLNQNMDQFVANKKDAKGIWNELETKMSMLKEELNGLDEDQLHDKLREVIQGKRMLLVLDDVSNMDPDMWKKFKKLLTKSNVGEWSRIIITTRNKDIKSIVEHRHELSNLDESVSSSLFKEIAFADANSEAVDSSEIEEMVKKCGGNPLALRTLGEEFNSKNLETFNSINPKTLPKFQKILTEKILPSLKPSYDFLPPRLKHCFAYCSIFPQQYEIDVKTLIHLWMAQGLIYPQPGQRMEDVGYEYFKNLHQRSLFEQVGKDPENVSKCKMPNLIQDLAVFVAGTRLATLREHEKHSIDRRTQHVSFHFHVHPSWKIPTSFLQAKRTQTIILPCQLQQETEGKVSHSTFENIISHCKALRVWDLHNTGIDKLPKTIGKLKYLRYLDLSQNKAIKLLPDSITTLPYLMILKPSKCYGLEELPRNMKNLIHLKHLENDWCISLTHMPPGLGELAQLETLSLFALKYDSADYSAQLGQLAKLNNLRGELNIKNLTSGMKSEVAKLEEKEHLKSLILAWKFDENANNINAATGDLQTLQGLKPHSNINELAISGYSGCKFPDWLTSQSCTKLVKFSLRKCKCQNLSLLSELSSLKVLILDEMANLKYISDESESHSSSSTTFMPSLEELRLTELPKLKGWWADVSKTPTPLPSFPCLSKLLIEDCPKLRSMPLFPNLKEWLVLDNTSLETFIQTMDSQKHSSPLFHSESLPLIRNKEIISEDGENDKIELGRLLTMGGQSSLTEITNDGSSSKATMDDKMPSHPLSKMQSLPIDRNMEISSEDGENDKNKRERIQTMDSEGSFTRTMNDGRRPSSHPLSDLQSLRIIGNKEISSNDGEHDKINWHRLTKLQILRFDYLPTLKNLPEGLQHVTTLEELQIWRCDIKTLPEWIKQLTSLKTLRLLSCPFLESLPRGGLRSSLKTLEIIDCPILLQRCQKKTGADWPLIENIENLRLQQPQSSIIFKSTKESTEEKNKQLMST